MGYFDRLMRSRRAKLAAEQMWPALRAGVFLEIPLLLDPDDLTHLTMVELQKAHPEVELRFFQKRGLVLGIHQSLEGRTVSKEALDSLRKGGQLVKDEASAREMLEAQMAWLRTQGEDPYQMEKEAQEARMKREAISVGGLGSSDPEPAK